MLNIIFIFIAILIFYYYIKTLLGAKKPLRSALVSMLTGIGTLGAASFAAGLLGAQIMINIYTVFVALTLGLPGVVLIILKLFVI